MQFGDLKVGQIFSTTNRDNDFMKIYEVTLYDQGACNCVGLNETAEGILYAWPDDKVVVPARHLDKLISA